MQKSAKRGSTVFGKGHARSTKTPEKASNQHQELDIFQLIYDSIYNGSMVTDAEGYITHFNKPYGEFLDLDPKDQIGKHCTEVIENTRMHIVAQTGKAEINQSHHINGQDMVVQRIPIKKNGKVIAVFGQVMFKDVRDVGKLAKQLSVLESKVEFYEKELFSLRSTRYTMESIVGTSEAMKTLKIEAYKAASNNLPVLISGESGTGKELFAQAIHNAGSRRMHPFIRINCAAIPKDLLESELFGYEKGAFTGARSEGKPGKFELAQYGTIFLDEIGDLPVEMQPKLLRVLEEKEFERVGGTSLMRADFRLIAASNQNLEKMLETGRFRKDLYYRLNVLPINITPLRERKVDIIPLAEHHLKKIAEDFAFAEIKIDKDAKKVLKNYHWPGNARELSNVLERVAASLEMDAIHVCDLPYFLYRHAEAPSKMKRASLKNVQARAERESIRYALESTAYNKARTAELLGIHRTLLYKKMKKYDLPLKQELNSKTL
ncbi:sigma-54 interaction domain-containing protein [Thermodesulfobacteriota bacterium]